jgi:hypothetical protein
LVLGGCFAVASLVGCGGPAPGAVGPNTVPAALLDAGQPQGVRPDTISTKDLFVGEYGSNVVAIYQNGTFKKIGEISAGINTPAGAWVDSHGLYISNLYGPSITEYSSPKSKPFTYSAGMIYPAAVTTDGYFGDVFEADAAGYVNEYQQKQNFVVHTCSVPGYPSGVAVDTNGNVFVVYRVSYSGRLYGFFAEFTDFSYCKSKTFGFGIGQSGGMVINKYNTILVTDVSNKFVDIIKPPYNSVSGHLGSGWHVPVDVTINSANNRAWVTDYGAVVDVYYPSGKIVATIPYINAISAVDGSNYAP